MEARGRTGGLRRWRALRHAALASGVVGVWAAAACYTTGDGTAPPLQSFYFPVGLGVSASGNVLYASNSDFDLQWNGGTVQSYDLNAIRNDTVRLLLGAYADNPLLDASAPGSLPALPWASGSPSTAACPNTPQLPPPGDPNNPGARLPIGEACAPPMNSSYYWRDSVVIGAFATDLQLSNATASRVFVPVRGDATLTWMDVVPDTGKYASGASPTDTPSTYKPFYLSCNRDSTGRCDTLHHAGQLSDPGNTRQVTMPGEPFGMAQSQDGTSIAITHQTENDTSLFLTGVVPATPPLNGADAGAPATIGADPSIQYVLSGVPLGGVGMVAVPHDPAAASPDPSTPLRPAFLQTSDSVGEIDLLRYYSDEGFQGFFDAGLQEEAGTGTLIGSSVLRPFLIKEETYPVNVNAGGNNQRGLAIDPTPRLACEAALPPGTPTTDPSYIACLQTPSRVFLASRAPASLILGQIGGQNGTSDSSYDPDALTLYGNVPLTNGPSNVYLAPIVDGSGHYALRVFIVCFDTQLVYVWDPDTQVMENIIRTGAGPFAMTFDPFDLGDVATHAAVPFDARAQTTIQATSSPNDPLNGKPALRHYRFAYLASFTNSFVQVIDLDQSFHDDRLAGQSTFETIVYTLGVPTQPKGSQ
jgi:hypothetical protein